MNKKDLTEITNVSLKNKLLKIDNLCILEELINTESIKLEKLQKLKSQNKLYFGEEVSKKELDELAPKLFTEIDACLDLKEIPPPKFGYFSILKPRVLSTAILGMYISSIGFLTSSVFQTLQNSDDPAGAFKLILSSLLMGAALNAHLSSMQPMYASLTKEIILVKDQRVNLIPTIAHEYAHYIQAVHNINSKYSIFEEGHARGIEKLFANKYSQKEDNEAFLYSNLDLSVGEFKSTYIWMCKELKHKVNTCLLKTKTNQDRIEFSIRTSKKEPSKHAIGNSLFSIKEYLLGKQIYTQSLKGNFQFT